MLQTCLAENPMTQLLPVFLRVSLLQNLQTVEKLSGLKIEGTVGGTKVVQNLFRKCLLRLKSKPIWD